MEKSQQVNAHVHLIQKTCEKFCNDVYSMSEKKRETGASLSALEEEMTDWLIQQLYVFGILVESEN